MELGLPEILIILVAALLFFGPGKVPQIGESLGRAIRNFRNAADSRAERPGQAHREQEGTPAPALPPAQARATPGSAHEPVQHGEPAAPGAPRTS
jgi:sec-independent protein translocase protein TatA